MDGAPSYDHAYRDAFYPLLGRVAENGLEQPRIYQEFEAICAKDLLRTGEQKMMGGNIFECSDL